MLNVLTIAENSASKSIGWDDSEFPIVAYLPFLCNLLSKTIFAYDTTTSGGPYDTPLSRLRLDETY